MSDKIKINAFDMSNTAKLTLSGLVPGSRIYIYTEVDNRILWKMIKDGTATQLDRNRYTIVNQLIVKETKRFCVPKYVDLLIRIRNFGYLKYESRHLNIDSDYEIKVTQVKYKNVDYPKGWFHNILKFFRVNK